MGRPKTSHKPQPVEPEDESQETPEIETPDEVTVTKSRGRKVSKTDAVRAALQAGADMPEEGVAFVKRHYDIEMTRQRFSTTKSKIKADAETKSAATSPRVSRKRSGSTEVASTLSPAPTPSIPAEADLLRAMETMKPLIATLGAEKVKRIVDLLG